MKGIIYISLVLLVLSCSKVEKLEKLPISTKLNVICLIRESEYFHFEIYKSLSALDNAIQDKMLTNAKVYLSENGVPIDTITYSGASKMYLSDKRMLSDKFYEIRVTAPGLPEVKASMKPVAGIGNIKTGMHYANASTVIRAGRAYRYYNDLRISCEFGVPEAIGGLHILLYEQWSPNRSSQIYYTKWKPLNTSLEPSNMAEYEKFQPDLTGHSGQWNGSTNPNDFFDQWQNKREDKYQFITSTTETTVFIEDDSLEYVVMRVKTFDAASYGHVRSVALYKNSSDNVFDEPVQLSGNIENGYGVFGSYAETKIKIPITRK